MGVHGAFGDDQAHGDLPVGQALGNQRGDVVLAAGERIRLARAGQFRTGQRKLVGVTDHLRYEWGQRIYSPHAV
jgi:hypothetical protein